MKKKYLVLLALLPPLLYACGNGSTSQTGASTAPGGIDAAALFSAKCGMCHDFKQDKIGPALAGVSGRWQNDTGRLKQFIRNSGDMIRKGDPYAKALYEQWHQAEMPSFPSISDDELNALVDYLK